MTRVGTSMRTYIVLAGVVTGWAAASVSTADDQRPLREARSDNRRFRLEIRPGRPGNSATRRCQATLKEAGSRGVRERRVWETTLVNDVAPAVAVIRNDGRFVVTLDEFRVGGARNALVIYDEKGRLLRHFILTDLLVRDDWRRVRLRGRTIHWLKRAEYAFAADADEFVITLSWDREIRIDLKQLRIVATHGSERAPSGDVEIPPEILAALFADEEELERREALDVISERTGMTIETLKKLAALGYLNVEQPGAGEDTRESEEVAPPNADRPDAVSASHAGEQNAAPPETHQPVAPASQAPPEREPASSAEESDETSNAGIPVPAPDPAEPVDYLQWLNEMTYTEGRNAGPVYQAAIEISVPWEGEKDWLRAAARGDADALHSPEIAEWIDANAEAIQRFRDATQYDFRGFELHSPDGSMMSALLPALSPMRELARATVADGRRLEADGRYGEAVDHYLDTLVAGAQTGSGPTMIENLVGQAVQGLAGNAILDLAANPAAEKVDFADLAARLDESYRPARPIAETVQFERAVILDTVQRVFELDPETGAARANVEVVREIVAATATSDAEFERVRARVATLDLEETVAEVNAYYDALTEAVSLPYSEGRPFMTRLMDARTAENVNPLLRMLAPNLLRVQRNTARAEALRRATSLVTNLQAHRQRFGDYPATLEAFGDSEFVRDPFSGGLFAYRRVGDDFVLYSVGGNGRDDGGVHDPRAAENDFVFWPRPE